MALTVLAGWHLQLAPLIRFGSNWLPVSYGSALGLLILAVALIALGYGLKRLAAATVLLSVLATAMNLAQDWFGLGLRTDALTVPADLANLIAGPTAMGSNTSLCMLLLAGGAGLLAHRRAHYPHRFAAIVCALFAAGIATLAIAGYLTQVDLAYRWGSLAPMAPLTALMLVLLAANLGIQAWPQASGRGALDVEQLRIQLLISTATSVLATALFSLIVAVMPLVNALQDNGGERLIDAANHRAALVQEALHAQRLTARQVAGQPRALEVTKQYAERGIGHSVAARRLKPLLVEALGSATGITGIERFDAAGRSLAATGERPPGPWEAALASVDTATVLGVGQLGERTTVVHAVPVTRGTRRLGTDIIAIDASRLAQIVQPIAADPRVTLGLVASLDGRPMLGTAADALSHRIRWAPLPPGRTPQAWLDLPGGQLVAPNIARPESDTHAVVTVAESPLRVLASTPTHALYGQVYRSGALALLLLCITAASGVFAAWYAMRPLTGAVVLQRDTMQARIAQALEEMEEKNRALQRANQDLEQFAFIASHDLQSPLRGVWGFAHMLEERYADRLDDDGREYLGFIAKGIEQMQSLLQNLVDFSSASQAGAPKGKADMAKAFENACSQLASDILDSGAFIECGPLPTLPGDPTQMVQLFSHLLDNAIKFRRPDSTPQIKVSATRHADSWLFTVRDHGIGIDAGYRQKIFKLFQRLHTSDQIPGTGIGLALCEKIVQRHGGIIWADAAIGGGTLFSFTLATAPGGGQVQPPMRVPKIPRPEMPT